MDESFALQPAQTRAALRQLGALNALTVGTGLALTAEQLEGLVQGRQEALLQTGRVEFGGGILQKLTRAFASSPYLEPESYAETLGQLQALFYALKNSCRDRLDDGQILADMRENFDGAAGGDPDYLGDILSQRYGGGDE